jgi:hypothetical protein
MGVGIYHDLLGVSYRERFFLSCCCLLIHFTTLYRFEKDVEGSGCGLFKIQTQHFPEADEEKHEKPLCR